MTPVINDLFSKCHFHGHGAYSTQLTDLNINTKDKFVKKYTISKSAKHFLEITQKWWEKKIQT